MTIDVIKLAQEHGATHKQSLGVYQFFEYELQAFANSVIELCAERCDVMADGWEKNPGRNPMAGYIASSNCGAEIRGLKG